MRRLGFSVVELLTAILILAIMAGVFSLSPNVGKLSAKREAEKIIAKIENITRKANHRRKSVTITFDDHQINFSWPNFYDKEEPFILDEGFTLKEFNKLNPLEYALSTNTFNHKGGHCKVVRDDGDTYFIILNPDGRFRTSP